MVTVNIAPRSTIYKIVKKLKERDSTHPKKIPGHPRKLINCPDRLLKRIQSWHQFTSSVKFAHEWKWADVSVSACTIRQSMLGAGLLSWGIAQKPFLSKKDIKDWSLFFARNIETGPPKTGRKWLSLTTCPSDRLGYLEIPLFGNEKLSGITSLAWHQQWSICRQFSSVVASPPEKWACSQFLQKTWCRVWESQVL